MIERLLGIGVRNLGICQDVAVGRAQLETDSGRAIEEYTLLIGRNGAGKSTLLRGLRFLSDLQRGSISNAIRALGGFDQVFQDNEQTANSFAITACLQKDSTTLEYSVQIAWENKEEYQKSSGKIETFIQFTLTESLRKQASGGSKIKEAASAVITFTEQATTKAQLQGGTDFKEIHEYLSTKLIAFPLHARNMSIDSYLYEVPFDHPTAVFTAKPDKISAILAELVKNMPALVTGINADLSELSKGWQGFAYATEAVDNILDDETTKDYATFSYSHLPAGKVLRIHQLSTGTINIIRWITASHLLRGGEMICIEEPENGIYMEPLNLLAIFLRRAANENGSQFLVSTHSPQFALEAKAEHVWYLFLGKDGRTRAARCDEDAEIQAYAEVADFGSLWQQTDYLKWLEREND